MVLKYTETQKIAKTYCNRVQNHVCRLSLCAFVHALSWHRQFLIGMSDLFLQQNGSGSDLLFWIKIILFHRACYMLKFITLPFLA